MLSISINVNADHIRFYCLDDPLLAPSPCLGKNRCIHQSIQGAFEMISNFFEKPSEPLFTSVEKKQTPEGYTFTVKYENTYLQTTKIQAMIGLMMNEAFPGLLSYTKYEQFIDKENYQKLLDRSDTTEGLIQLLDEQLTVTQKNILFFECDVKEVLISQLQFVRDVEGQDSNNNNNKVVTNYSDPSFNRPKYNEIDDFFRRVAQNELDVLFLEENKLPISEERLAAFSKGDFQHPIYSEKDWIKQALIAFKQKKLTKERMSILLLFAECQQSNPGNSQFTYQLLDENKTVNQEAFEILRRATQGYFSEDELTIFINKMKEHPCYETQFFKVDIPGFVNDPKVAIAKAQSVKDEDASIMEHFYHVIEHKLCLIPGSDGKMEQVIFSPDFFYELLKVKCGDDAVKPNGVLGLSSSEDFENVELRDVLLPARFLTSPTKADGLVALPLWFYHHDLIYHVYNDSLNTDKSAWLEITRLCKANNKPKMTEFFVDRDYAFYARPLEAKKIFGEVVSKGMTFWVVLATQIDRLSLFDPEKEGLVPMIMHYIDYHQERWKTSYGIALSDLRSLIQAQGIGPHHSAQILYDFRPY